jgi:hypothetical protein
MLNPAFLDPACTSSSGCAYFFSQRSRHFSLSRTRTAASEEVATVDEDQQILNACNIIHS